MSRLRNVRDRQWRRYIDFLCRHNAVATRGVERYYNRRAVRNRERIMARARRRLAELRPYIDDGTP